MKRSKTLEMQSSARLEAEDRAFDYLVNNFNSEVSIAVAIRAEFLLALRWKDEQDDMIRRRDGSREVIPITPNEINEVLRAFTITRPGNSNAVAEQHVFDLFTKFPADRAWWIAHKLRHGVEGWWGCISEKKRPAPSEGDTEIPDVIKRAARGQGI